MPNAPKNTPKNTATPPSQPNHRENILAEIVELWSEARYSTKNNTDKAHPNEKSKVSRIVDGNQMGHVNAINYLGKNALSLLTFESWRGNKDKVLVERAGRFFGVVKTLEKLKKADPAHKDTMELTKKYILFII